MVGTREYGSLALAAWGLAVHDSWIAVWCGCRTNRPTESKSIDGLMHIWKLCLYGNDVIQGGMTAGHRQINSNRGCWHT